MSFQGKKNIYVCNECFGHIVTVDVDDGVTPFMTDCHATTSCKGTMKSSMYRVYDQSMLASHEWYRPTSFQLEGKPLHVIDHVERGGLLLREVERLKQHRTTLEQCEKWFDEYEKIHLDKGDTDKAKRNKERADACRIALGKTVDG